MKACRGAGVNVARVQGCRGEGCKGAGVQGRRGAGVKGARLLSILNNCISIV